MLNQEMIKELAKEIEEKVSVQMETGKMVRMQQYAEDGNIDATHLMAFVLAESKLYSTLFTTELLSTISQYEEMEKRAAEGGMDIKDIMDDVNKNPLEMEVDFDLRKVGDEPPENLVVEEQSAMDMLLAREEARKNQ